MRDGDTDGFRWLMDEAMRFVASLSRGRVSKLICRRHTPRPTAILEAIPWARRSLAFSPRYFKRILAFRKLSAEKVIRRVQAGSNTKDLFHYLVRLSRFSPAHLHLSLYHQNNEDGAEATSPPLPTVISDATTAVVAGSDTAASVLCCAFFFILTHQEVYSKLKDEVDKYYPPGEDSCNTEHYSKMAYLDAVM